VIRHCNASVPENIAKEFDNDCCSKFYAINNLNLGTHKCVLLQRNMGSPRIFRGTGVLDGEGGRGAVRMIRLHGCDQPDVRSCEARGTACN
jgi:hypothetical protein